MLCIEAFNIVNSLRRLLFVCILRWVAEMAPSIRILSSPEEAASILPLILPGSSKLCSILLFPSPLVPLVNLEKCQVVIFVRKFVCDILTVGLL